MAKTIEFTYGEKAYTLEYTRKTVKKMEDRGFVAKGVAEKPMTYIPQLFAGAFLAHHPFVAESVIDEIYSKIADKESLLSKLVEMYNEPISTLVENDSDEGNIEWGANW